MSKAKPCPKLVYDTAGDEPLSGSPCSRPKKKGKQACEWHWLLRQSSDVQAAHARGRIDLALEAAAGGPFVSRVKISDCPPGERWCAGCQTMVPLFYTSGSRCKACVSMAAHARRLETVYDIDAAEYERIFKLQGGRCAICRNRPATKRLATDHDHKTGDVRGLLCKRCNHDLLGGGHDSVAMLWRAITYLLFPPAQAHADMDPVTPGRVVAALRAHLEREAAEARKPAVEPLEPPF